MKKTLAFLLAAVLCVGLLAGCGTEEPSTTPEGSDPAGSTEPEGNQKIDTLRVAFVPSREPDEIITATEPLKQLLTDELAKLGYDVGEVDITVGTSYEAVGEALSAGTADVGLIPGGTYVLYDDGCDVILTATRDGLSIDSDSAKDWNDNAPTEPTTEQVTSYRALMIAGPSAKGQELAAKINAGEELTWDDVNSANWSVANSSSPAGYIYPSLWLQENFGKNITDLDHV
ncbi:MAG: PhnD/SsuA/transferrin family substrate-binding protein, partial [Oscillospiraceae bacterium]|nr:PhnD/SsuA/transferrin family substrate-binding protein [Oscillospiraceae bacterium]